MMDVSRKEVGMNAAIVTRPRSNVFSAEAHARARVSGADSGSSQRGCAARLRRSRPVSPTRLTRVLVTLVLVASPAFAQERAPTKGVSLAVVDSSIEALVRAVNPSVVQVFVSGLATLAGVLTDQTSLSTTHRGTGSGVIVGAYGYIVTNAHVVRGASRIRVEIPTRPEGQSLLTRRSRVAPARIIGVDEETDIAV